MAFGSAILALTAVVVSWIFKVFVYNFFLTTNECNRPATSWNQLCILCIEEKDRYNKLETHWLNEKKIENNKYI